MVGLHEGRRFRCRCRLLHQFDAHQLCRHGFAQVGEKRLEQLESFRLYSCNGSRCA